MIDTSPSLILVALCAVLVAVGVYLILERSLSRIILGFSSLSNGVNIGFLIAGGRAGAPPIVGQSEPSEMSDPLTQAMILTAIVITMGTTAFMLALAYRSWQLDGNDEVQDDIEDRRLAVMAERDERLVRDEQSATDDDAADVHDETEVDSDDRTVVGGEPV